MIYVFDVDGTLTPSRQPATEEMVEFLLEWGKSNNFYLCSGSDLVKIKEQLPEEFIKMSSGVFSCMGNTFHKKGVEIYNRDFNPPGGLLDDLLRMLENSKYPVKCGNHIESRMGMWNFSIVGRNADLAERKRYNDWDSKNGEREAILKEIEKTYRGKVVPTLGGEISIDITGPNKDKSQVFSEILKLEIFDRKITFIGDRTLPGGNDFALAKIIKDYEYGKVYQTRSWEHTIEILSANS